MPWIPELFSAPVLERLQEKWELERLDEVPYYDGPDVGRARGSDQVVRRRADPARPARGRVTGVRAFEAYVSELGSWLSHHNMSFDPIDHVFTEPRGFEEVVLHLDGEAGSGGRSCRDRRDGLAPYTERD